MTAAEIAKLLHAHPAGRDRWRGPCPSPAHISNSPKLSIREGNDGRTLIHCFAGCRTEDVLEAAGLAWHDLFTGPPPTPEQRRRIEAKRERREAEAKVRRRKHWLLADKYRTLNATVHSIAIRLADMPEGCEGDSLALVFHAAIDQLHDVESIYDEQETCGFHNRLVRFCDEHHMDYERLIAPHMDANANEGTVQPRRIRAGAIDTTWRRTEPMQEEIVCP